MLVGRDSEIARIEEVLRSGKHALVVISSKPGMGRSALLKAFRNSAMDLNWLVLPAVSGEEKSAGTIEINWKTTEKDFREKVSFVSPPGAKAEDSRLQAPSALMNAALPESAIKGVSPVSAQSADTVLQPPDNRQRADLPTPSGKSMPTPEVKQMPDGTLILIDSYQPDKEFESWLLGNYIPEMRQTTSPVVMVVAGYAGDLAVLAKSADMLVELGELQLQATIEHFRNLNMHIEDKMEEKEIQDFAVESSKDPVLIDALTRLLQLR